MSEYSPSARQVKCIVITYENKKLHTGKVAPMATAKYVEEFLNFKPSPQNLLIDLRIKKAEKVIHNASRYLYGIPKMSDKKPVRMI